MALSVGVLAGLATAGLLLMILGVLGYGHSNTSRSRVERTLVARVAGSALSAGVVLFVTGWPVAATYAFILSFVGSGLWLRRRQRQAELDRLEGLAEWLDVVRDALRAASGLEQALLASTLHPPDAIAADVKRLGLNLRHRPLLECLREFGDGLGLPASDRTVVALMLTISSGAGRLVPVLTEVSTAARREVASARIVAAERAGLYSQANSITLLTVVTVAAAYFYRREEMAVYDTFGGQAVMAVLLGFLIFGLLGFHKLASERDAERPFAAALAGDSDDFERPSGTREGFRGSAENTTGGAAW